MSGNKSRDIEQYMNMLEANCSDSEIQNIFQFLQKRENFQKMEAERVGVLEVKMDAYKEISSEREKNSGHCFFCSSLFIILFNPNYVCNICQMEFCKNCLVFIKSPKDMQMCQLCHKKWLKQAKSGQWMLKETHDRKRQQRILGMNKELSGIQNEIKNHFGSIMESKNRKANKSQGNYILSQNKSQMRLSDDTTSILIDQKRLSTDKSISAPSWKGATSYDKNATSEGFSDSADGLSLRMSNYSKSTNGSINSYGSRYFPKDFQTDGKILLKIEYTSFPNQLKVKVISCENLGESSKKEKLINPYVKIYLLPDKSSKSKRKTTTKMNTKNPVFNEEIVYHIDKASLSGRTLNVAVWNFENMKTNIFLGETNIPVKNVRLNDAQECWYSLKTRENIPQISALFMDIGEILIGLQYIASERRDSDVVTQYNTGKFNIFIRNGRNIGDAKNVPSPFIKCTMVHLATPVGRKESKVISNTTNPTWDETFTFMDIDKEGLSDTEVTLIVMNKKIRKNEELGVLYLSTKCREHNVSVCREKDILLWKKFLDSSGKETIQDYLPLRSFTE